MENINFNDGYKEYSINGDDTKVVRFNPSDMGILARMDKALSAIADIGKELKSIDAPIKNDGTVEFEGADDETLTLLKVAGEQLSDIDKKVRAQIDYLLDSDVSSIAFGNQSCLSMVGGKPLYERFLDALMPIIKKDVEAERNASKKRVEKYTKAVKSKC